MLFNSYEFIFVFLPVTLFAYFSFAKLKFYKLSILSLVLASLGFYSYWDIRYVPLLLGSIVFNYTIGAYIEKKSTQELLAFAIAVNLALLGWFKYFGFFTH